MNRGNRNLPTWTTVSSIELLSRLLVLALALALLAVAAARAAEGPYYVKGTKVNLREMPQGSVLTQLNAGEKLFVIERAGDWWSVSLPVLQLRGWMHRDFIDDSSAPANTNASVDPPDAGNPAPLVREARVAAVTPLTDVTEVLLDSVAIADSLPTADSAPSEPAVKASSSTRTAADIRFNASVELTSPSKLGDLNYKPAGGHQLASISAAQVNLREQPSLGAPVVGTVDAGDRAHVITNNDPWYLVSVPARNLRGWVFGEYIDTLPRVEIKADDVRLRDAPGLDSRVREQLAKGDTFFKLDARDGWVQVASSASGLSGWVKAEYVRRSEGSVSRPYGVTGDQVNFRAYPAVDSDVIARLPSGAVVNVLGRNDQWAYVYFEGYKGWMYDAYLAPLDGSGNIVAPNRAARVTPIDGGGGSRTLSWKQVGGHSIGNRLIERANAMLGTPYVWGGHNDNGVDCSGLIYKLLCDEGVEAKCLPRRASEQMAGLGLSVDKEELAPGDLVFFTTYKAGPSHVGIYLGDGDFIHASSAQRRVTVSNMSEGYYRARYVGARRITEEEIKGLK